jgi:hypothetical protein
MEGMREQLYPRELAAEVVAEIKRLSAGKRLPDDPRSLQASLHEIQDALRGSYVGLHSLVALLESKGFLTKEEYDRQRRETLRSPLRDPLRKALGLRVARSRAPAQEQPTQSVDCSACRDICHAKCCSLSFALTREEIRDDHAAWNEQRPFVIQHGENGYCVHLDRQTFQCAIYENRPGVCRRYSCEKDKRIRANFEKKIPPVAVPNPPEPCGNNDG